LFPLVREFFHCITQFIRPSHEWLTYIPHANAYAFEFPSHGYALDLSTSPTLLQVSGVNEKFPPLDY
jgi:hypothetical protein